MEHRQNDGRGLAVGPFFSKPGTHPFDAIAWERREAKIASDDGGTVFEQKDVEIPKGWSQLATNVVVSKYFRGKLGSPERERSVKQMVARVADAIARWGKEGGYFANDESAETFRMELTALLVNQRAAFNSPVWFNVGVRDVPQCSACFILSVEDNMESILEWIKKEGIIFKGGSGSGINLSTLRSSKEHLSGGGTSSGPVSFMRGADATAGSIKSGGTTRRAAKMVVLNADHPDIVEFIHCKEIEEKKAWALGEAGYDMSLNGEAWKSIQFQNANNSVRVTDSFMRAVEADGEWQTRAVTTNEAVGTYRARDLLRQIAEAAWVCGDPGMQYDTTINAWHTCSNTGRINASNPCSEYMHLDDSACNLASLNLMTFLRENGSFDVPSFKRAVDIITLAQDIIVGFSSYPTPEITKNAKDYRELGLGYANLGALLMLWGLPYDSDEARAVAASITALMTGEAYAESARIARVVGPFAGYERNKEPMLHVLTKHRYYVSEIDHKHAPKEIVDAATESWDAAITLTKEHGIRNSQVTVLAPTGTISFLMDCDTTGIEPDIALVKFKKLVGGGVMRMVNRTVPLALRKLGYAEKEIEAIVAYTNEHGTIEGAPHLKEEHLPVFDCAFQPVNGKRSIHYMGHVRMMAAAQPFISGAISKTVNVPASITVEDVMDIYLQSWKLGLKALAIYRDGSKRTQPLSTKKEENGEKAKDATGRAQSIRRRLPEERPAVTHKFSVNGHEGYVTVGLYEDKTPGEIFITMAKSGSTISGLMDAFATSVSIGLQYGVPLKTLVDKFIHTRYEPAGFTGNPDIPIAKSITDYIFRWLSLKFLPKEDRNEVIATAAKPMADTITAAEEAQLTVSNDDGSHQAMLFQNQEDAPPCSNCGAIMVRNASCYKCLNCGISSGCS